MAILDGKQAHIGVMANESVRPFSDIHARVKGPCLGNADALARHSTLLNESGIFRHSHSFDPSRGTMQVFDMALEVTDVIRPRHMEGFDQLSAMYEICSQLCLFLMCQDVVAQGRFVSQLRPTKTMRSD